MRVEALGCKACPLWANATQTVFGEGTPRPLAVLVGEQPGDKEDQEGRPFVGPAGTLLDRAMSEAQIERRDVYLTNVVKHFKWKPGAGGKRRLHDKPSRSEIDACRPWLDAELARLEPPVLVLLGATATQALLGSKARVTALRGRPLGDEAIAPYVVVTAHPSSVLRSRSGDDRRRAFDELVADLCVARDAMRGARR